MKNRMISTPDDALKRIRDNGAGAKRVFNEGMQRGCFVTHTLTCRRCRLLAFDVQLGLTAAMTGELCVD